MQERGRKNYEYVRTTMNSIDEWMGSNQLKMNASKTQFILFGTNHQLKKTAQQKLMSVEKM